LDSLTADNGRLLKEATTATTAASTASTATGTADALVAKLRQQVKEAETALDKEKSAAFSLNKQVNTLKAEAAEMTLKLAAAKTNSSRTQAVTRNASASSAALDSLNAEKVALERAVQQAMNNEAKAKSELADMKQKLTMDQKKMQAGAETLEVEVAKLTNVNKEKEEEVAALKSQLARASKQGAGETEEKEEAVVRLELELGSLRADKAKDLRRLQQDQDEAVAAARRHGEAQLTTLTQAHTTEVSTLKQAAERARQEVAREKGEAEAMHATLKQEMQLLRLQAVEAKGEASSTSSSASVLEDELHKQLEEARKELIRSCSLSLV
jgi:predicted  nucleic acid-binding Zn-ribbon protein